MLAISDVISALDEVRPVIERRFGSKLHRMVGARADVQDLIQTVSLKAVRSIDSFDGSTRDELRHWVLQIARNTYKRMLWTNVDCLKRSAALDGPAIDTADGYQPNDEIIDPSYIAGLDEQSSRVLAAMEDLPLRQADAVRMRYVSGLDYEEIAVCLGCSVGAARKLVSRGLSIVRHDMTGRRSHKEQAPSHYQRLVQLRLEF